MTHVNLSFDTRDMQRVVDDLVATETEVRLALNSTMRKMSAWLRVKSVRGLAAANGLPPRVIRRRVLPFRIFRKGNGLTEITIFYGLDPVGLIYLGARQTKAGVSASNGRSIKSAFIATGRNGNKQVFKRRGKERLPLDKQRIDILDTSAQYIEDELIGSSEFNSKFISVFEHELKWRQTRKSR